MEHMQSIGAGCPNRRKENDVVVTVDTREKKWSHIKDYFDRHCIQYVEKKLDEGDYQVEGLPNLTIDRKKDLQEVYQCLSNQKSRFYKEVRRCYEKGIKLVVLIEHGGQYKTIADVAKWTPKYGTISGREISERLYKLHISYGVEVLFCDKRSTARRIIEILTQ